MTTNNDGASSRPLADDNSNPGTNTNTSTPPLRGEDRDDLLTRAEHDLERCAHMQDEQEEYADWARDYGRKLIAALASPGHALGGWKPKEGDEVFIRARVTDASEYQVRVECLANCFATFPIQNASPATPTNQSGGE